MNRQSYSIILLLVFTLALTGLSSAIPYTSCGQQIVSGNSYELTQDLSWSSGSQCVDFRSKNNVVLDCQGNSISSPSSSGWVFFFGNTENVTIKNCNVHSVDYFGFSSGQVNNLEISNNEVYNFDNNFLRNLYGNEIKIINNNVHDGRQAYISVSNSGEWTNSVIRGNSFLNALNPNSWYFQINNDISNLTIEDNVFANNPFSYLDINGDIAGLYIRNNEFANLTSTAEYSSIYLRVDNNHLADIIVEDNSFISVKRALFILGTPLSSDNIFFSNNQITNPLGLLSTPLELGKSFNGAKVSGNSVVGSYSQIFIFYNSSNLVVEDNVFGSEGFPARANAHAMLFVGGKNNIIRDNYLYLNNTEGIFYIANYSSSHQYDTKDILIEGNEVIFDDVNSNTYGIRMGEELKERVSSISIRDVIVKNNKVISLLNCVSCGRHSYLFGYVNNGEFYNNYAYGGNFNFVIKGNDDVTIRDNTGYYPRSRGILDKGTWNGVYYGNKIYGNSKTANLIDVSDAEDSARPAINHTSYSNVFYMLEDSYSGGGAIEGITRVDISGVGVQNVYRDNNIYVLTSLNIARFGARVGYFTPAQWAGQQAYDKNSLYCVLTLNDCYKWSDEVQGFVPYNTNTGSKTGAKKLNDNYVNKLQELGEVPNL